MKTLLKTLILTLSLGWASVSYAAITDGQFGPAQIFDVQYYWSGDTLNVSNMIAPYDKNFSHPVTTAGDYYQFFDSTTDPGTYGLALYDSDGNLKQVVHDTGTFSALGNGAIFYLGSGFFGTVITTAEGFSYGDSASFTLMDTSVSDTDLQQYAFASTTPLAAGETAGSTPAPTPIYLSSITQVQQAQKDTSFAVTSGNNIDLTITGSSNDVDITQLSDGNYLTMVITGNSNITNVTQSGTNLDRNFADIGINGSTNELTFIQQGDSEKTAFLDIDGSFSTYTITQQGSGEHYLDLTSLGDSATVTILQEGLGNHSASISLENGGGNWDFTLTQSGDNNQLYSLPHDLSDNTVVTGVCYTGTCTMVINQQ